MKQRGEARARGAEAAMQRAGQVEKACTCGTRAQCRRAHVAERRSAPSLLHTLMLVGSCDAACALCARPSARAHAREVCASARVYHSTATPRRPVTKSRTLTALQSIHSPVAATRTAPSGHACTLSLRRAALERLQCHACAFPQARTTRAAVLPIRARWPLHLRTATRHAVTDRASRLTGCRAPDTRRRQGFVRPPLTCCMRALALAYPPPRLPPPQ